MSPVTRETGSCPICGNDVPRMVAQVQGRMHETYRCPDHGPVAYGPQAATLREWTAAAGARLEAVLLA